ncbi:predicted protein [Uncinocarpus reesii 1704]|uniref:Uncharacterized protein n=1 Tax=Uncinocarpus reesii (strain UAMH 1704) TaxID=336963 RepID=C4JN74_UNCRE|nr:uncharacterized protein UREG_04282 [Uncinocarpus reesii 1704]EEP79436.1 predicted protein [Uncinocarpus reesii 1704]
MSPSPVFTFGAKDKTDQISSTVNENGYGVVVRRDKNGTDDSKFYLKNIVSGIPADGEWPEIKLIAPDEKTQTYHPKHPFYLGYDRVTANPILYVHALASGEKVDYIQHTSLSDYKLSNFKRQKSDFHGCSKFFAKRNLIALCDAKDNYRIISGHEDRFSFPTSERLQRVILNIGMTGGLYPIPVVLMDAKAGSSESRRIKWWKAEDSTESYFENSGTKPEAMVCFDDYIVWHSNGADDSTPTIGWIDIKRTGKPTTSFESFSVSRTTVAIANSGDRFKDGGHTWYATSDGGVYYFDASKKKATKMLTASDIKGASSTVAQLWADKYFLYVLTGNGLGAAFKITTVV